MLFEEKERTSQDPKSHTESDWDYLNRSGRPEAQRVRTLLNHWVSNYPDSQRCDLISRISSGSDRSFQSATFELIIFGLLRSLGCSVEVHPDLRNGKNTHPDFLALTPSGESVYVEAVLASEHSEADISTRKRVDTILSQIEKSNSPNFFLGIKVKGHLSTSPKGKRLRTEINQWLASLDPDDVIRRLAAGAPKALPSMEWEHEGWRIVIKAIPKKLEKRGLGQRVIGTFSEGARSVNAWEPIRDAIMTKGRHYGELAHPLIVAINGDALSIDIVDDMQGLFGQEEFLFQGDDSGARPEMRRRPNGAWYGPRGPRYTRVSGCWIFHNLEPWNLVSRANTLYFNPWSRKPLPNIFTTLNHAAVTAEELRTISGRSLSDLMGLPASWPK